MNNPVFHLDIFLVGCIGALAPEIIRLYNLRTNTKFSWSWFYLVISLLFALLGGLIAWILPSTTYYGAFYAGVAAPVIVNNIMRNADQKVAKGGNDEIAAQSVSLGSDAANQRSRQDAGSFFRNYWRAL